MEQQLLGYKDTLYRLDKAEHIAADLIEWYAFIIAPRILRTRRNLMTRPPEQIRPYLRRAEFEGQTVTDQVDCEANMVPQHGLRKVGARRHRMYKPLPVKSCVGASCKHVTTGKMKSLTIPTIILTLIKQHLVILLSGPMQSRYLFDNEVSPRPIKLVNIHSVDVLRVEFYCLH
ncbi:hypothetical protein AHAS_Ahas19G0166800 [Arachis hypogaea]